MKYRGACRAAAHGVAESDTAEQLNDNNKELCISHYILNLSSGSKDDFKENKQQRSV